MRTLILIALAALMLAACGSSNSLKGISGKQLPVINIGADNLNEVTTPTTTQPYSPKASPNGLLILYLGYTNCPDICPTTMSDIRTARQSLSALDQKRISTTFVTVDQSNDTPTVLLDYVKRFGFSAGDHAIRPTDVELQAAEKTLFASSANGQKAASGIQIINHTAETYVVNSQGMVVDEWDYGLPAQDMAHDLKALLKKA